MEMDELLDQIKETCAGKSVEEIEQEISESSLADRITDAHGLARYFLSLAGDVEEEPSAGPGEELSDE